MCTNEFCQTAILFARTDDEREKRSVQEHAGLSAAARRRSPRVGGVVDEAEQRHQHRHKVVVDVQKCQLFLRASSTSDDGARSTPPKKRRRHNRVRKTETQKQKRQSACRIAHLLDDEKHGVQELVVLAQIENVDPEPETAAVHVAAAIAIELKRLALVVRNVLRPPRVSAPTRQVATATARGRHAPPRRSPA